MRQLLFSLEWFRNLCSGSYFVKVNGVWSKYSKAQFKERKFKQGERIEQVYGPGIHNWIFCQNNDCRSMVNFGSFTEEREVPNDVVWDFKCTCCGTEQHFIPDFTMIPCNKEGAPLPKEMAA